MKYIGTLVDVCIAKGYITLDQAPWLYYGIEKRVTTILISIPMLIIGSLASTPAMSIAFYISFCSLRARTNGLHAKTLAGCLILSIISEILFLKPKEKDIRSGDIVVFNPKSVSDTQEFWIKRVIGTGGDTVEINYEQNTVAVNGELLSEPYINQEDDDPIMLSVSDSN